VAKFSGAAGGAAVDAPPEHQPAAHAGAERKHHKVLGNHPKLVIMSLSECRDVGIVIDEHWNAQPFSQQLTQRNAGKRHVDRCDHPSSLEVDDRWHAQSNRVELGAPHTLDERNQLVEQCLLTGVISDLDRRPAEFSTAQGCGRDLGTPEVDPNDSQACSFAAGHGRAMIWA
jgi:hypothetical protein